MAKGPNTTTAPTGQIAPFGLRMLPDLKERIEQSAKGSGRSMNAEIVARLQQSFEAPAGSPAELGATRALLKVLAIWLKSDMLSNLKEKSPLAREARRAMLEVVGAIAQGDGSIREQLTEVTEIAISLVAVAMEDKPTNAPSEDIARLTEFARAKLLHWQTETPQEKGRRKA